MSIKQTPWLSVPVAATFAITLSGCLRPPLTATHSSFQTAESATSTVSLRTSAPFGAWSFECVSQGEMTDLSPSSDNKDTLRRSIKAPQFILRGPELEENQFIEVSLHQPVIEVSGVPAVPASPHDEPQPQVVALNQPFGSVNFVLAPRTSQGDFPLVIKGSAVLKKRFKDTITVSQATYIKEGSSMETRWNFQGATLTTERGLKLILRKFNQWDQIVIEQADLKKLMSTDTEVQANILSTSIGPVIPSYGGSSGLSFTKEEIYLSPTVTPDFPSSGSLRNFKIFLTYETKLKESSLTFNGKVNLKKF